MTATREITAKFKVQWVEKQGDYGTQIRMGVDYMDGRNKEWAAATPWGEIVMVVKNELAAQEFTQGRAFTVTFTPED